jgi:transcriptional regulator with XRE-family HTH domain
MDFPNKLREVRKKANVKATDLAELLDITFQHYYAIERGQRQLSATHLNKISNFLNVSADEILGNHQVTEEASENKKVPKDMAKFLEQTEVMFDGETYRLDDEDKEKLRSALEFGFWHAKEKNKRKK